MGVLRVLGPACGPLRKGYEQKNDASAGQKNAPYYLSYFGICTGFSHALSDPLDDLKLFQDQPGNFQQFLALSVNV
jgi:hypothetical protein